MIEKIKSTITDAFKNFNAKHGIPMKDIRIKITKNNGSLNYFLMNQSQAIAATELKEIVGSTAMLLAGSTIRTKLHNSVEKVINENGLNEENADVQFLFSTTTFSPIAKLYNNGQPVKDIDIEKLLN